MTPEEIASDIVSSIPYIGTGTINAGYPDGTSIINAGDPDMNALEMAIAQAIRDAYERAAIAIENNATTGSAARALIAADIRALKDGT